MRVLGTWGPSGICSFAERGETPASPASISSPTYGWEKQNFLNGESRVEEGKGRMVGNGGASWMPGSRLHLWVHHDLSCSVLPLLQGLHPAPLPPPWAPRNPQRASLAPGEAVGGEMQGPKHCRERGIVLLLGCCMSEVPCQVQQNKRG